MIFEASEFVFKAPPAISRARRVLIKPTASRAEPYPVSTSRDILSVIIDGIRRVSDADIVLLEGVPDGGPVYPNYQALGYSFPRVLMLDVRDCIWVEVDNPLPKPLAVPTFWIPNVILSSDYLISVAPLMVADGQASLTVKNLLTLLPNTKYGVMPGGWEALYELGKDRVVSDLYFTLPFDLGIIEAQEKLVSGLNSTKEWVEICGKVFVGEPYQVDREAVETLGLRADYLDVIKIAEVGLNAQ
ncbi:MAG: hypothetical protein V3S10_01855 [Dehalococcoidales bacterium]